MDHSIKNSTNAVKEKTEESNSGKNTEIQRILEIQKELNNLTPKSIVDVRIIVANSKYAKSVHGIRFIINEIKKIVFVRPFSSKLYANFLRLLYELRSSENCLHLIPILLDEKKCASSLFRFVRECIINKIMNINKIIESIESKITEETIFTFIFFSDLILKLDFIKYKSICNSIKRTNLDAISPILRKIILSLEKIEKKNFSFLMPLIEYGWPQYSIQYHIIFDDVSFLVDYSTSENFNIDMKIHSDEGRNKFAFTFTENATIIDFCAFYGAVKCFKYLLLNGAKLTKFVMLYAFSGGNNEIIHICEQNGIEFTKGIFRSVIFRNNNLFKYSFDRITKKQKLVNDVFLCAAEYNNLEVILELMKRPVDYNGKRLAESIINFDSIEIVKLFRSKGCNFRSLSCVVKACKNGNAQILKFLLENHSKYKPNPENNEIPIVAAAMSHDYDTVKVILDYGADPNVSNMNQYPLHYACMFPNVDIVKLLVANGADINVKNKEGNTPLQVATKNGYKDIVDFLKGCGAKSSDDDDCIFEGLF